MRSTVDEVVSDADVLVIGSKSAEFRQVKDKMKANQVLIDLVRIFDDQSDESYQGFVGEGCR